MLLHIHPGQILFHCITRPSENDVLWGKIKNISMHQNISLKVIVTEEPIKIWGHIPTNLAHKSDVIRMKSLRQYGGMYFDLDIIIIKSVSNLRQFPMTIAGRGGKMYENSVLFTVPYGTFINTWFDSYKNVDFSCWGCHSLVLPMKIAEEFPTSVNVIPGYTFFPIGYSRMDSEKLFGEPKKHGRNAIAPNIIGENTLAVHLWANNFHIYNFLKTVNSTYLCNSMSLYANIIRASFRNSTLLSDECYDDDGGGGGRLSSPFFTPYKHTEPAGSMPRKAPKFYHIASLVAYDDRYPNLWQCAFALLTILLVCYYCFCRKGKYSFMYDGNCSSSSSKSSNESDISISSSSS